MTRLLEERGRIGEFDYDLSRKVLDHIEVTADGKLVVIFSTGTRVTVGEEDVRNPGIKTFAAR